MHEAHIQYPKVLFKEYHEKAPEPADDDASVYSFNPIIVYDVNSLKIVL